MHGFDLLLFGLPLLVVLVAGVLRLDEHVSASRHKTKQAAQRPRFSSLEEDGEVLLTDPDGRVVRNRQRK